MKKYLGVSIAALAAFGIALHFGVQSTTQNIKPQEQIETATVSRGDIAITVSGVGQVFASSQVELKAVEAGDAIDIESVHVENNQTVTKDQIILTLDSRDAQQRVYDAQLALNSALIKQKQTEKEYSKETQDHKYQRQLQEVTVAQKKSALSDAQRDLSDYTIRAPFDGILTDLSVEAGDSISRTDVIATVITTDTVAEIELNEVDAANVSVGNTAELTFDALPGKVTRGTITHIDTIGTVTQGVVSYDIEISIDASAGIPLKPGMSVNADIAAASRDNVLRIPNSAISTSGTASTVTLLTNGQEKTQQITTGLISDFYTEVTAGISEGDQIVTRRYTPEVDEETSKNSSMFMMPGMGGPRR